MLKFEGQFKSFSGGYGLLRKKAVAYADEHKLKTNYVYYRIPDSLSVNGINLSALTNSDQVEVIYYQCGKILA